MKNIYFIFPYKGIGGVPVVFSQLANHISKNKNFKCFLVDYKDGYMFKNNTSDDVTLVEYRDTPNSVYLSNNCIAIFQSIKPWSMYKGLKFSPNTKIFYWNCHPFNLVPLVPGIRKLMQSKYYFGKSLVNFPLIFYKLKLRKLIKILHSHKSIAFMDYVNYETTNKFLNVNLSSPEFIPIPYFSNAKENRKIDKLTKKNLKIVCIGRLVDFKYYSLKHFLNDLNKIPKSLDISINLKIVGTGEYKLKLVRDCKKFPNLQIEFITEISRKESNNYLQKNADLIVAMGTSALQGASLSIPTILLDIFYKNPPNNYQYEWLHKKDGKSLGEIYLIEYPNSKKNNLLNIIIELFDNYAEISEKTYNYFKSYHDIEIVSKKFIDVIVYSKCSYDILRKKRVFNKSNLYSLFSFIRDKNKK